MKYSLVIIAFGFITFGMLTGSTQARQKSQTSPRHAYPLNPWSPAGVSAHANASAVSEFLRNVLRRSNIDNKGGPMNSSINCVVASESSDGRQWFNAFWKGTQMVYGQRRDGANLISLSVDLDVVGHEMFHGVTDHSSRLEYAGRSGALNESYSDILSLRKDCPDPRPIEPPGRGRVIELPQVSGLHHRYERPAA